MRSIELGWLSRRDKRLPLPELSFEYLDNMGGYYHRPDTQYRNGMLVISTAWHYNQDEYKQVMAHEWQHHCQYHNGIACDPVDLEETLYDYFTRSASEMSALRFQLASVSAYGRFEPWIESLYPFVKDVIKRPVYSFALLCGPNSKKANSLYERLRLRTI